MIALESALNAEQASILLLWQRVNASLSAFHTLITRFKSAASALLRTPSEWAEIKIHAKHVIRHREAEQGTDQAYIASLAQRIANNEFQIVFSNQSHYPQQLLVLFYAPPLLFFRGNSERLNQAQIAIVGSRKPTVSAQKFTFDMAQYLAKAGYIITSGLAQGVDNQAHLGALSQMADCAGRSIGVMGTGIDVCYPKQHQPLFDRMIAEGGCIVSELLPGTPPNKHTFPRRNRLVAGLSLGTIVTEATINSGSLITARLTSEQGKQVFAMPSRIDNSNAEGCHHLIREGATLIYHPEQVINDLSSQMVSPMQRQALAQLSYPNSHPSGAIESTFVATGEHTSKTDSKSPTKLSQTAVSTISSQPVKTPLTAVVVPDHLQSLWVHIDYSAQDLDGLIQKTQLDTSSLLSQLMELELMGLITQIGGRYQRL